MLVLRSLHQLLQAASFESSGQCFSPFVVTVFILKDLLIYIYLSFCLATPVFKLSRIGSEERVEGRGEKGE